MTRAQKDGKKPETYGEMTFPSLHLLPGTQTHYVHGYLQ